jgi:hypothetical protein
LVLKRRLSVILLIISLTAPFAGSYFWLQHQKAVLKKELKWELISGIDKSELVLLSFTIEETKTKLRWEHSKEFEYNQQMYDIVASDTVGDTINYWCWWDHEETKLNKQLKKLVLNALGGDPFQKKKHERLNTFIKNLYFHETDAVAPMLPLQAEPAKSIYIEFYTSLISSPPVPPPRYI